MSERSLRLEVVLKALDQASGPLKEITGNSRALSKGMHETRARLKALGDTQKRVGAFRELRRAMQETDANARAAQARVRQLAQQMNAAEQPTRALTREHQHAVRAARALSTQLARERQHLDGVRASLAACGINTKNLAQHQRALTMQTSAASRALHEQEARLARVNKQQQRLHASRATFDKTRQTAGNIAGAGVAGGAIGGGILFGAKQLLAPGYDFNASMSRVQALARIDKNSPQLAALRSQARQLGATTSYTASQAADGQGFLAMAGFRPDQILKSMPSVLSMAKAGDLDLAGAADISSNIMSGFGLDADQMQRVADVLTMTFTTSNTNLSMLGDTMKYVGPVAKTAGMSLEQAAATAGLLGNAGIQASQAGTTLRSMLLRLASPTSGAGAALKELGVRAVDAKGNVRDIPAILRDVAVATQKMGSGKRLGYLKDIFGEEPAAGMAELIAQQGAKGIDKYIEIVKASQGTAGKVASVMADNLKGDVQTATSAWEDLGVTVSDTVDPTLRSAVQRITQVTGAVSRWAAAHPELTRVITNVMLVLGILLVVLGSLSLAFAAVLVPMAALKFSLSVLGIKIGAPFRLLARLASFLTGGLMSALKIAGRGFLILGRFVMGHPIVALLALIAMAAVYIWQNWETLGPKFAAVWEAIKRAFGDAGKWIAQKWAQTIEWFKSKLQGMQDWFGNIGSRFTKIGSNLITGLVNGIKNGLGTVKDTITGLADSTVAWFKEKLGIHSPSRVFATLGGFTMAGLEQGLREGQDGPLSTVLEVGRRIVAAGAGIGITGVAIAGAAPLTVDNRPPLTAAAVARAPVAPAPITIQVYAAPGMDERALAQKVLQVMRQEHAAQAARARSRLRDRD
ncbi:phage tail tape measure protein [Burkholderia cepacia]|uniref:Phage tail tape measure protein n=1 Tax=Burkholderia cepacia TaxID=292 RepID=A0A2S8IZ61_BURCE|nr:phage tail tape measure protein [Burkholderia cepacia]PQP19969.1 phage tail tape measure protein [Burkholderia cepacia]HDR9506577.1 phage tail tape measure protein [Burkholderia cepacia]